MNDLEAIKKLKDKLLLNLDAQMHTLRYRIGVNTTLTTAGIDSELSSLRQVMHRITQLHEVANSLRGLDRNGINRPLQY